MTLRLFLLLLSFLIVNISPAEEKAAIAWQPWSDSVFEKAKKDHRFVLLDLGAVWCHWCHVMDRVSYQDPEVIRLINERYIAVRVDQDSRPDLANRYEDYGWPATIVFAADGSEIVKRRGYIPPVPMASMLQAIIDDPSPGPSVLPEKELAAGKQSSLSPDYAAQLNSLLLRAYDSKNKGWGTGYKFLDWNIIEYCLAESSAGNKTLEKMARETLRAQGNLMDPVWGGVYQYSTDGDWKHPHYEKLMQFQAENLRVYSLAYSQWQNPIDLQAAEKIRSYLLTFLAAPEGAFYTSQDADLVQGEHSAEYFALPDKARRQMGIPKIDTHIYARENGWAIQALLAHYSATGNPDSLGKAVQAANWIVANRRIQQGGYRHDEKDPSGPYLGDSLSMGRALLALYAATGNPTWLQKAEEAAAFIENQFKSKIAYVTSAGTRPRANPQLDENVDLARFTNLLYQYSGKKQFRDMAEHTMRYLSTPEAAESKGYQIAGILLANKELAEDPLHISVVGGKKDPVAASLFLAALKWPGGYKRTEWIDPAIGFSPRKDVTYPSFKKAAAFLCTNGRCSSPVYSAEQLAALRVKKQKDPSY